ncbi:MAG: hypothetical protein U9N52_05265 [Campylobacterota bacterium]|nr:hypothetical protein [Campylobacterota bacterium]
MINAVAFVKAHSYTPLNLEMIIDLMRVKPQLQMERVALMQH